MELRAWLGEEPAQVVRRSRYERALRRMDLVLKATAVCLPSGLLILIVLAVQGRPSDLDPAEGADLPWYGYVGVSLLGVGVALAVAANRLWRTSRRLHRDMLVELARELGLQYANYHPSDPYDRYDWAVEGAVGGREVSLRRDRYGLTRPGVGGVCVLSASHAAGAVSLHVGFDRDSDPASALLQSEERVGPQRVWQGGELSPGVVADLAIGQVLVLDGVKEAEILVEEDWARLTYTFGTAALDYHPQFVRRALAAAVELAEHVEQWAAERPAAPPTPAVSDEP